jgi:hypothetical protein
MFFVDRQDKRLMERKEKLEKERAKRKNIA